MKAFEAQVAALDSLRQQPNVARKDALRKALGHRNNFIVAKAADLAREFQFTDLTDDLLKAFERFYEKPEKTDPQCWAKNAVARTLAAFEVQEADIFLRGMRHIQMEPVWGGRSDTAGTLRSTCAFALVQCRSLSEVDLLAHLLDLLADSDKTVRAEAARAIEQVGSPSASLLLRLRAVLGKDEPEVLGACYNGVLRIEGTRAIAWVACFLKAGDDSAGEAALAIAATRSQQGFEILREHLAAVSDPWFRSVLLSAIALTRQDSASEFLIEIVRSESPDAEPAIEAFVRSAPAQEVMDRMASIVADNPRLARCFSAARNPSR